jgi:hypothetical protein
MKFRSNTIFSVSLAAMLAAPLFMATSAHAQAAVAREVIEQATEQIFRHAGQEGLRELTEMGGEATVRSVLEQASREGGEQLFRKAAQYGIEEGPDAIRMIGRGPTKMVSALDDLSPSLRSAGIQAVERDPQVLVPLVSKFGAPAMEAAARHPGVGEKLVQSLGSDGISLSGKLTTDQAVVASRYATQIADLAPAQRSGVVSFISKAPQAALNYLETHPKTLLTSAGVVAFMASKDQLIGDKGGFVIGPDGNPIATPARPGMIERLFPSAAKLASTPINLIGASLAAGIAAWFGIHLWGKWRTTAATLRSRHGTGCHPG